MLSDFLYQFYLSAEYHAIHKEHEECEDKHEEYVDENQDEFFN